MKIRRNPVRYELFTMAARTPRTTFSATEARRFLQSGRNLAARSGRTGTFGRWVLVVYHTPDGPTPFATTIHDA